MIEQKLQFIHGLAGYRNGCRCPKCTIAKKELNATRKLDSSLANKASLK
jgi:hypothetical protein